MAYLFLSRNFEMNGANVFQMREQGKVSAPDLKNVIPYVKRKVLQGTSLVNKSPVEISS
jgi:hypothetical protein